jgi:zona occludens toxin
VINGLEGIPGAGKSYEAVVYHVLQALKEGRMIITNLPLVVDMFAAIDPAFRELIVLRRRPAPVLGTWDANRMDEDGNGEAFQFFADGHQERPSMGRLVIGNSSPRVAVESGVEPPVFGSVWDYYSTWRHPKSKRGPLFVIDECHVPLPRVGSDPQVIEWFKLHRHFNCDVLLMTQNFRDMCNPIAGLLAILIRCRKADFLGKKDAYVRRVFAGFRGALISEEQRDYKPEFFPLYKSHTQGQSVGESGLNDVKPFIVKWKRFTYAYWVVSLLFVGWLVFWPSSKAKPGLLSPAKAAMPSQVSTSVPMFAASGPVASASASRADGDPDPLAEKGVHLKGSVTFRGVTRYFFVVSQNGQQVQEFTGEELRRAGYVFRPMGDCLGALEFKGKTRPISCDLPAVQIQTTKAKG